MTARKSGAKEAKQRIGGGESEFHVLGIPLRANARERRIIRERFLVLGLLKRAFLRLLLKRVNRMHRDPDWQAAKALAKGSNERRDAFREVRKKHGLALSQMGASELCKTLWRGASSKRTREFEWASELSHEIARALKREPKRFHAPTGWMTSMVAARVAGAAGKDVWKSVEEYLYGNKRRPHTVKPRECRTAWNEDNRSGMYLDGDHLVWEQPSGSGRKDLRLALTKREGSAWWGKRLEGKRVLAVGITEDAGVFYALLRVAGAPYRDPEYLASVREGEWVGMDPAPTNPAFVSDEDGAIGTLATEQAQERQRQLDKRIRRMQRAQDRSRRAMNPDCFDERGRAIRGKRQRNRSNAYNARQKQLKKEYRRARAQRRTEAEQLTRQVMAMGTRVAAERTSHKGWQASLYGKRMRFTRPGELYARLRAETSLLAHLFGNALAALFLELPTSKLALSQHCLCGHRERKPLSKRVHHCQHCGLGPLQRDLFSAFLALLIAQSGLDPDTIDLSEGLFNSPDNRAQAVRLCGVLSTGHKQPSRPASSRSPIKADKTALAVCRQSASDLDTPLVQGVSAGMGGSRAGSEETRPLATEPHQQGSRTTSSGGGANVPASGPGPPGPPAPPEMAHA